MVVDVRGRGGDSDEHECEGEEIAMLWEAQYL